MLSIGVEYRYHAQVGGITGALCAYTCMQAGLGVVVLDGRSIGTGSTCASTALLQYEIDTPLHELVDVVGEKHAVRSYVLCAQAIERLEAIAADVGLDAYKRRPIIQYTIKRAHVKGLIKEHALRKANGFDVELLQGEQ